MKTHPKFTIPFLIRLAPAFSSGFAVLIAALVLWGWFADVAVLKSIVPTWATMKVNTALAFCFGGVSLWLLRRRDGNTLRGYYGYALAGLVVVVGVLTMVEHVTGKGLGIDQLLFTQGLGGGGRSEPGRMSEMTAVNFIMLGLALLGLNLKTKSGHRPLLLLPLMTALVGLLAIAGYLYDVNALYGVSLYSSMAMHTAWVFVILSIGVLCARAGTTPLLILTNQRVGGAMARRLLPFAVVIPLAVGSLCLLGERRGLYDSEFGMALFSLATLIAFGLLIWLNALWLNDIDEKQTRTESLLHESERRFRDALDNMVEGYQLIGRDWRYLYINDTAARYGRMSKEQLLGRTMMECYPGIEQTELFRRISESMNAPEGRTQTMENEFVYPDGSSAWFALNLQPTREGVFIHSIDITERKRAQCVITELNATLEERVAQRTAELEAKNRELETFTYSVSHDLKAPLRGIDGYSRLLLEEHSEQLDDEGRRFLDSVRKASVQMGQLIDDLLAYSKLERRPLRMKTLDLNTAARSLLLANSLEIEESGVSIEIDLPQTNVHIDVDGLQLALRNLIDNALKFSRNADHPAIKIGGQETDTTCILWVKDNGIGFDMKFAGELFNIFQRLHRAEEYSGTGVGLAIVRKAMEQMGGRVWAEGAIGEGATFYLEMPKSS